MVDKRRADVGTETGDDVHHAFGKSRFFDELHELQSGGRREFRRFDHDRIAREEVFGPVLAVIPFEDEEDAIAIGNDVVFGLAAGVWTRDIKRALTMANRLQAGTVWVNTYRAVSFMSPFGGYKRSGIGRESGQEMIKEYLQTKSVWISTAAEVPNPFVMR